MPNVGFDQLTKLADSGILGILLVLAILTIIYLYRALIAEKDKEAAKQEQATIVLKAVNDTMKELLIEIERRPHEKEETKT